MKLKRTPSDQTGRPARRSLRPLTTALLIGGLALGAAALAQTATPTPAQPVSAQLNRPADLRPALSGERRYLTIPDFGRVAYYADDRGQGRPLVLTSSVNAAASAYEMKPIWDAYVGTRPVYALEWPGFGSSDRPDVTYTRELMTAALNALVRELNTDVDVVGLSLGSEFVARAALLDRRIHSLALISPSGLGNPRGGTQEATADDGGQQLYDRLNTFSTPLYAVIRTRPSIQYFLSRSFRGPVDGGLIDYSLDTTRQPGAKYAPIYFISGRLFTPDAYADLYARLDTPTLVLYDQDGFVSFDRLQEFTQKSGVQAVRIEGTDGLPHFEKLPEVRAALDAFWAAHP
ncbi:alpha/beta fold hydrolase [Deinococcus knuensis]|uniref:Alpha/beta hydrolase n=1 Tax=Deinococcus knuensis TaxID=1837380 RepID=A0ABQ2SCW3_9DEIO|nr:alpha/beta fold hydrolase [Deinococcus knuensis]GGS13804.1 alpha/beta hydrolase [Deinococcus knuensis]